MGEGALEDEEDIAGPSSQFGAPRKGIDAASSSSCVRRRFRGRKIVELLAEAVLDFGRSILLIVLDANVGF